jgi:putative transposase
MSGVRPWTCPTRNDVVPIRPAALARIDTPRTVAPMPRPLRPQLAGAIYHVTSRGNRGGEIYRDDADRVMFLSRLLVALERFEWDLHAWCLLSTHFHLLVTTRAPTIARGMQELKSRYAELFNGRYGHAGHLFGGRYAHRLIRSDGHLMNVYSYIALNPVRAGMCARPEDWWWSSYSGILARREGALFDRESLLVHFAERDGRRGLRRVVERALAEDRMRLAGHVGGLTPDMALGA